MEFALYPGIIALSDDRSARHPTMFGPTGKLPMKYDYASLFSEPDHSYRWAFDLSAPARCGDVFAFAAVDREVACAVGEDGALAPCAVPAIVRDAGGVPLRLASTPPPAVTVLIVTLDRRDLLEKTLWYLYETSTDEEREIWVWDNGSHDDTAAFLGTLRRWPGVRCFRSEVNLGIAGPRKRMIPHVRTPYVLTLDDDMWLLNRGWATGVRRALDADPSIYQLAISITGHWHNNYGIVHAQLDRPFFNVPYMPPTDRGSGDGVSAPPGSEVIRPGGETVVVPTGGGDMPFAVSGSASAWRTADLLPLVGREERHHAVDLSEAWGHVLREQPGRRNATIFNYRVVSPCPGPLWHLGRGERYWEEVRCRIAPAIYNRTAEEQRSWLEAARAASGWGQPLEDPDAALPVNP